MTNSPLPVDHEIRVLVTIKNGMVISEKVLPQKMLVATVEEFIELATRAGKFLDLANSAKG